MHKDTWLIRNCPKCNTLQVYKNKYNLRYAIDHNSKCASCRGIGRRHSTETKEKIRLGNVGKIVNSETRRKLTEYRMGKKHSEKTKAKVSESLVGNTRRLGIPHTNETKLHLSLVRKGTNIGALNPMYGKPSPTRGVPMSDEQKKNLSRACLGRKMSDETKRKLREIHFRKKIANGGIYVAKHNPIACEYFNWINKQNGWDGKHAKNGGEVVIGNYFLDYYEPNVNLVIEWDEPQHYYVNGMLKPKDVFRMNFIKSQLKCEFYRVNSTTGKIRKY